MSIRKYLKQFDYELMINRKSLFHIKLHGDLFLDLILFLSLVVSTLLNFVRMFIKAHEENCKQIELEKKRADKEAESEKSKLAAAKKESEQMLGTTIKSGNIK